MLGFFRSSDPPDTPEAPPTPQADAALDRALDTLAAVLRSFGKHSFDLDGVPASRVQADCDAWARHVLTGAAVHDDLPAHPEPKDRAFAVIRRRFADLRAQESRFLHQSVDSMRSVLWGFVGGLQRSFAADAETDRNVLQELDRLRSAVASGRPEQVQRIATEVVGAVEEALQERRTRQETAVATLGARLREVREDLK